MSPIPREAREGLTRAWLAVLSDRHPEVFWAAASSSGEHEREHASDEAGEPAKTVLVSV